MNRSIRGLMIPIILFPFLNAVAKAENAEWAQLLAEAEKPLVDLRSKYDRALENQKIAASNLGQRDRAETIGKQLDNFRQGGWPGADGTFDTFETAFIVHYWRYHSSVEITLKRLAAQINAADFSTQILDRIDYWAKAPPRGSLPNAGSERGTFQWKVKSNFMSALGSTSRKRPARDLLEDTGISFPTGASAVYDANKSTLIVRNSLINLIMIDRLLAERKVVY